MSYLEVIERNGKEYYYVTKNFRVGPNKWKKVRKYLGREKPDKKTLESTIKALELEAKNRGMFIKSKFAYLDETDAEKLEDVHNAFRKWFGKLRIEDRESYQSDFLIRFTYNTNAIEGNRLSLRETAMIFNEGIIPEGASINDFNEALNSRDVFGYIKEYKGELNKRFLLKLHKEVAKNTKCRIIGAYRDSEVRISGSDWVPPPAEELPDRMKKFFQWYNNHKNRLHPVELGALAHVKLVQIHPFTDGNGRVARVVMNWILLKKGYPMFYIETKKKIHYYNALEAEDKDELSVYIKYIANTIIKQFTFTSKDKK